MLVNPEYKTNKLSETSIALRIPQADAVLLNKLVEDAKAQGLVNSKSAFIRYVLNDYVKRQAEVLEVE